MNITIEKDSAEFCNLDCPFLLIEGDSSSFFSTSKCTLFGKNLFPKIKYGEIDECKSCSKCRDMFNSQSNKTN